MAATLRARLLQDIAELQNAPYPNITLHVQDGNLTTACLILHVEEYSMPMHLTVEFPNDYPLRAPKVCMNSDVNHPNIFGQYICASILNTEEGYTPAYTLKSIAIQLLSFFTSDKVTQSSGRYSVDLARYRAKQSRDDSFTCSNCRFGLAGGLCSSTAAASRSDAMDVDGVGYGTPSKWGCSIRECAMADEILMLICDHLETEDLMAFAESWTRVGVVMGKFDVIRTRELQCFCLKKDYTELNLGVGVDVSSSRKRFESISSEFDLLSREGDHVDFELGFYTHHIRRSTQGIPFQYWLPLPISNGHWRRVRKDISTSLSAIANAANYRNSQPAEVIYAFMNDIVVKLNDEAEKHRSVAQFQSYLYDDEDTKSTLTHASEKAIESYFHLFHLLLSLATADPSVVQSANAALRNFSNGQNSKEQCPNMGHLLVAALISDEDVGGMITKVIKETITRNVVWMLDAKGANMPELAYLEPSEVSHYRLQKTFEASKTSYRILMFLNLFRSTAVGGADASTPRKSLETLRDGAFARHGAPPTGTAKELADSIKKIHKINNFWDFQKAMDVDPKDMGGPAWFTQFLRLRINDSMNKGYSMWAITQVQALYLRLGKDPNLEGAVKAEQVTMRGRTFFPNRGNGGRRGGGGRGGRR